ncbi:MAG: aminodeoxyfutalosine deaminase [Candidatus Sumerlaeota bacterium]|nr:aminodeoxyfutalosine deaminase [Candidatus Sumerlaeota bacterium]
MPGFFNAHCHLELGFLRGAIPPSTPFVEWLGQIARRKRAARPEDAQSAIAAGLFELRESGTQALLDIDSMRIAPDLIRAVEMPCLSFTEIIAFDPAEAVARLNETVAWQNAQPALAAGQGFGLSPHAPYTTTPELLATAAQAAREAGQWLCIHAAETPEETEMLLHGRGALHDFLNDFGSLPQGWKHPGMRPVEYLAASGVLGPHTLLAHLNEVTDEEIALLAKTQTRAVVCPGTHVYFGRGAFPLKRLLDAGVATYLGTDSLASNESLSMMREIDLACELEPALEPRRVAALADAQRARDFGLTP